MTSQSSPPPSSPLFPQTMKGEDLVKLHELLWQLKNFMRLNYDPRTKPPSEEDITKIEEYLERVVASMTISTPPDGQGGGSA